MRRNKNHIMGWLKGLKVNFKFWGNKESTGELLKFVSNIYFFSF